VIIKNFIITKISYTIWKSIPAGTW